MSGAESTGLLIDTHVHLRKCFREDLFFDVAWENARHWAESTGVEVPWVPVLMLTESATEDGFHRLHGLAGAPGQSRELNRWGGWFDEHTADDDAIWITKNDKALLVIAGRQVDTGERLEVSCARFRSSDSRPHSRLRRFWPEPSNTMLCL